jgi:acyl-CoA synthetase (AMP-forming)/AMP-acid ligase II
MAMMDVPLNAWLLFGHAARHFGDTEVVTRRGPGDVHRYTYADFARRAQQLMHALDRLGVAEGERVATLGWNSYRHLECYFAVPCAGRVLHTLNPRLPPAELGWIIADADDREVFVDAELLPVLEQVPAASLRRVRHIVVLADPVPSSALPRLAGYEELIGGERETYPPKQVDERAPLGLSYTSGTTGRPKGVVSTHRSTVLHALAVSSGAGMSIGPQDCVLPVVPMFHVNAWGMPHAAVAVGAKQVFLAGPLNAAALAQACAEERVTVTAGVPTVWLAVADELTRHPRPLPALRHIICGGSQPPRALIERYLREFGIDVVQAWGMTETSPLASVAWPKHAMRDWDTEQLTDRVRTKAGLPIPGVDVLIRDADGQEVPFDGATMGDLYVRGPWVADGYWRGAGAEQFDSGGWFHTGDVAVGSPDGYFVIADRSKDLIKSGGEWISSLDMEADIMAMPQVAEAAVVAMPDPRWQERPLAFVVVSGVAPVTLEAVRDHLESLGWARWQLPDRVELIDRIPVTGTGKFDKKLLRARLAGPAAEVEGERGRRVE